ncbi:hypothetical protein JTE90_026573 [Oedothorax gibbosus]|uniref:Serine/threonine-protein phosphatase 6 regulatory subunit 3 n=1 Tax=Oedothorax gibbosus TaxID=931172 RepID=A0AAV6U2H3_9ARAC|nr:hypothetical protein JTE90_026573 [Oedothorax gibbosus]
MFWRYNLITGNSIETLLDKENVTLKELLEDDDILQECKAQTKKLLDFLVRPESMDEMVTLVTHEPPEDIEEKNRYKLANRACELLTFDIPQINDALASDKALLEKLYNFLTVDGPINPLLASFFSKTMGLLVTKKTEVMCEFFKDKDFISLILKHLDTSAIMDLLLRFLTIENSKMQTTVINWLNEQKLIQQLVNRIDVEYGEEFNCNASNALCDIIKVSRDHMSMMQEKAEPNPLLEAIESVEVVTDLLNHMFKDVAKESAIVNGILVLLSLLVFKKQGPAGIQQMPNDQGEQASQADNAPSCFLSTLFRNNVTEQISTLDAERLAAGVYNVLAAITPRLEDFHNLLLKPPVKPAITFTIGCLDPPLGSCRLEVAHLLTALLYTNNHLVNVKLASLETVVVLLNMFFKYSWNNFLHTQVEQSIGRIITNPPTVDSEGNKVHPLLEQILTCYKITNKICESFEEDPGKAVPGVHRKGYLGHLTKIANHIAQNTESGINSSLIKEKLAELSEEEQKKWDEFVAEKLAEINRKNKVYVVNNPPLSSSADEDSIDFRDVPFGKETAVHLAFSDYQMHEMTSNFVDQFGFNDDEFGEGDDSLIYTRGTLTQNFPMGDGNVKNSAELFEEVCNAKMNSSDGDAVLWANERDNPSSFGFCFRMDEKMKRSGDESSSDSDEEAQVFEAESTPIVMANEEIKMDIDSQEAIMDGVPMEVAPGSVSDPWGTSDSSTTSGDDQQGWADFSNFATFGNGSSNQSSVPDAMETSEFPQTDKCDPIPSGFPIEDKLEVKDESVKQASSCGNEQLINTTPLAKDSTEAVADAPSSQ